MENPGSFRCRVSSIRSKRNIAVVGALVAAAVLGLLRAAKEIDGLGDDLASVSVVTFLIGPFGVVDAAANQNLHARIAILLDRIAEAVEGGDPVPLGVLHPAAFAVADDLAFQVAGALCSESEVGDSNAALTGAGFWGLADVACEDDDVLHFWSPLLRGGTIPSDETRPRLSGDSCIAAFGGGSTLKVRVERAAARSAATRPKAAGVAGWKQNGLRGSVSRRDWMLP